MSLVSKPLTRRVAGIKFLILPGWWEEEVCVSCQGLHAVCPLTLNGRPSLSSGQLLSDGYLNMRNWWPKGVTVGSRGKKIGKLITIAKVILDLLKEKPHVRPLTGTT